MKAHLASTLVLALLLAGTATVGVADDSAEKVAKVEADEGKSSRNADEIVCKRIRVTGSHFKKRVCQRESAWVELRHTSQQALRDLTDSRVSGSSE